MKIIFFGAGNSAYNIWQQVVKKPGFYTDEYLAFADNNATLWGTNFCGKPVIAPTEINKWEADLIVIASLYENSIRRQLVKKLGISKQKIYSYDEYFRRCYAIWIYRKRYGNVEIEEKQEGSKIKDIVIYTAMIGDYDELREPLFLSDDITYVCMTNNKNLKSDIWNIEYISDDSFDDVYLARHIKMNPHIYFHDYETSIWVDGKYQIMDDLRIYISLYQKQSNILCFPHPERECICDEAAVCINSKRGNKKDIILQVAKYLKEGFPLDYGLYETGCIVRAHKDEQVKRLMEFWEEELLKNSVRDQLSFPYVCWKNNFTPDICDLDVNRNRWLLQRRTLYK